MFSFQAKLTHWTKKIIVEEGHTVAQLVHMLYVTLVYLYFYSTTCYNETFFNGCKREQRSSNILREPANFSCFKRTCACDAMMKSHRTTSVVLKEFCQFVFQTLSKKLLSCS